MKKLLGIILILLIGIFITGCEDENDSPDSGTLTVQIFDATTFNNHSIYYTVYDSNETDPDTGMPTGNALGYGAIDIAGNTGSFLTVINDEVTAAVFPNGTYYLGGCV
jgi:hypothetical protein